MMKRDKKMKQISAEEYFRIIKEIKRKGKSLDMPVEVWDSAIFSFDRRLGNIELKSKMEKNK